MNEIQANHGMDANVEDLLVGNFVMEHKVSEGMAVWIKTVKQIDKERKPPKVMGVMTKEQF